ncbi:pentatricopeptide repeat-containing protein [Canna indica]|uniref:Elongation factor Ts, mitochondrial n=1 Tax=Canna indica TaxID=4628 RepID=A0AAQ3QLJ6_9LILI|nr:pentatricopeptide repeat-containing protein [Canna indica]
MAFNRSAMRPIWLILRELSANVQPKKGYFSRAYTMKPVFGHRQLANQIALSQVLLRGFSTEVSITEQMNLIKQLRERTSSPIKDVKTALVNCNWDLETALKDLRKRGVVLASKKSSRTATEGLLSVAQNDKKAVVIELNCETDFVARNDIFQNLASSLAKMALSTERPTLPTQEPFPFGSEYLENMKINLSHPKLSGETTVQNAVAEVAAIVGENVKIRRGYALSTSSHGVIVSYLHTSLMPGSTSMPKILNRLPSSLGKSRSTIIGHNAYNWNIILRGFLEGNAPNKVILAYALMRRKRVKVDSFTILFVIKACGVIMQKVLGKQVHAQVTKLGFQQEVVTQTAILQMYGLFGDIEAADKLFGETPKRDIVQWNALLAMYSQRNRPYSTIKVAQRMVSESVRPNEVTVVSIISACSHLKALAEGKQWHGYIIKHLAVLDTFVHNALVNMYAICGCLSDAEKIFKNLGNRNEVSWTTMINAYGASGYLKEALELFKKMEAVGETPDEVTMLAVVSICAKLGRFDLGKSPIQIVGDGD